jgi:hypothetical protein
MSSEPVVVLGGEGEMLPSVLMFSKSVRFMLQPHHLEMPQMNCFVEMRKGFPPNQVNCGLNCYPEVNFQMGSLCER